MVTAFQGLLVAFMKPAQLLITAGQEIQELTTEMERVEDVMKYPVDVELSDDEIDEEADYDKLSGKVELKNVTFGYSRLSEPLITDFSMSLDTGSTVAFVGSSGCGKSTLAKLISGLYQPWSGEILFDGKHISEINRSVFTGSVAVVDQDITLFEDTIENNIKMWDNTIEDYEVMMAARDAQIHEDIIAREGGYKYKLCEGGRDFSGGQRQRLEIARVLAQDPTIVIMDEATSALDAKTEFDVVNNIKRRDITCIIIAHRLSTIRDCDEIVVFDHGKVVERGTHEELMALEGAYTKLVTSE
jgi:ABC-type bacteriocin/lantibiotic exporter with double-glycine peptidase domain